MWPSTLIFDLSGLAQIETHFRLLRKPPNEHTLKYLLTFSRITAKRFEYSRKVSENIDVSWAEFYYHCLFDICHTSFIRPLFVNVNQSQPEIASIGAIKWCMGRGAPRSLPLRVQIECSVTWLNMNGIFPFRAFFANRKIFTPAKTLLRKSPSNAAFRVTRLINWGTVGLSHQNESIFSIQNSLPVSLRRCESFIINYPPSIENSMK